MNFLFLLLILLGVFLVACEPIDSEAHVTSSEIEARQLIFDQEWYESGSLVYLNSLRENNNDDFVYMSFFVDRSDTDMRGFFVDVQSDNGQFSVVDVVPANGTDVVSFEECVAEGHPIVEADPSRVCRLPDGTMFTEQQGCLYQCGDGVCQQAVCLATSCPCAETARSCPVDCTTAQP